MTRQEFYSECLKRAIDPSIALEDDDVFYSIQKNDDEAVIKALDNNF